MASFSAPAFVAVPFERYLERTTPRARRLRILRESVALAFDEPGIRQSMVTYAATLGVLLTGVLFCAITLRSSPLNGQEARLTAWIWIPIGIYVLAVALLTVLAQAMVIQRVNSVMLGSPAPQRFLARHARQKLLGLSGFAATSLLARIGLSVLWPLAFIPAVGRLRRGGRAWRWRQTTYIGFATKALEHGSAAAAVRRGIAITEGRWGQGAREVSTLTAPVVLAGLPLLLLGSTFALLGFRSLGLLTALAGVTVAGTLLAVGLGCYAVAVYIFALGGPPAFGFRAEDLAGAFTGGRVEGASAEPTNQVRPS